MIWWLSCFLKFFCRSEYHLLVPLRDDTGLSRAEYGRIKVALTWKRSGETNIGQVAPIVKNRLQAECLIANAHLNAVYRGGSDSGAAAGGADQAMPEPLLSDVVVNELLTKLHLTNEDITAAIDAAEAAAPPPAAPAAAGSAAPAAAAASANKAEVKVTVDPKTNLPIVRSSKAGQTAEGAAICFPFPNDAKRDAGLGQGGKVFELSNKLLGELENLCRSLPATGHALSAALAHHMRMVLPPPELTNLSLAALMVCELHCL